MNYIENDSIFQKEINSSLQKICEELENIHNINSNYLQYISALIYALYYNSYYNLLEESESLEIINVFSLINTNLSKIREKEKSKILFININFYEVIQISEYETFKKIIGKLVSLMGKIDKLVKNGKEVLANAFEYIIENDSKKNKVYYNNMETFYTPKELVKLMVNLSGIEKGAVLYNPASGTGDFIVESARQEEIYAFGEEKNINKYNICITNLWLHNISNKRIDVEHEKRSDFFDFAIANPPFVEKDSNINEFLNTSSGYIKYLNMMLNNVNHNGKIITLVPQGFLFKQSRTEYITRRNLLEKNYIDAIITLPERLFYDTTIPVVILVINKNRRRKEILFIDASREYKKSNKWNILTKENQNKIIETYKNYNIITNYSNVISFEEIKKNDYDLNIKEYVRIQKEEEYINEKKLEEEIIELEEKRRKIDYEIEKIIRDDNNWF